MTHPLLSYSQCELSFPDSHCCCCILGSIRHSHSLWIWDSSMRQSQRRTFTAADTWIGFRSKYLTFPFDLLLFAKASLAQIRCIQTIVSSFCASSGQRINPAKSKISLSPNEKREISASLSSYCAFSKVTDLGRYLGVPILPDGRRSNLYADIVSRVQTKLAGWKANCLSLAGTAFSLWIESGE